MSRGNTSVTPSALGVPGVAAGHHTKKIRTIPPWDRIRAPRCHHGDRRRRTHRICRVKLQILLPLFLLFNFLLFLQSGWKNKTQWTGRGCAPGTSYDTRSCAAVLQRTWVPRHPQLIAPSPASQTPMLDQHERADGMGCGVVGRKRLHAAW